MKIGIMQPYFFPYIGYWQLMNYVDVWIYFDIVQFKKKSWMSRNRVLNHTRDGWVYINLPIKNFHRGEIIKNIEVAHSIDWKGKIIGKLTHYKKVAPQYDIIMDMLRVCFKSSGNFMDTVYTVNSEIVKRLYISTKIFKCSELDISFPEEVGPGEWALYISDSLSATQYINLPGGRELFRRDQFAKRNIELLFLEPKEIGYDQRNEGFIGNLSIIDVLMFNDFKDTCKLFNNHTISR